MYGENVMSKVTEALGVELGEVFVVENSTDNNIDWFRLTIDGIEHFSQDLRGFVTVKGVKGDWRSANYVLGELLVGRRMRIRRKIEQEVLF